MNVAQDAACPSIPRYGLRIGGVPLLLPEGVACEYLVDATVYPVPRAPDRLLGLIHLRGHAVPALDASRQAGTELPVIRSAVLIVLGQGVGAVALKADEAPQSVTLDPSAPSGNAPPPRPSCAFSIALREPRIERVTADVWWQFDCDRLVAALIGAAHEVAPAGAG